MKNVHCNKRGKLNTKYKQKAGYPCAKTARDVARDTISLTILLDALTAVLLNGEKKAT